MLYFIYGNDRAKGLEYFQILREKLLKNIVNTVIIQEGGVSKEMLSEAISVRGLFGGKTLFIIDSILEKKEEQEIIVPLAEELDKSVNFFIIFEPTFSKELAEKISLHASEVIEKVLEKKDAKQKFNIFSLGDALGERNKKNLWILYQNAVTANMGDEVICGTLYWAIKNMALTKNSAGDVGLNPFSAKKFRKFAQNYTTKEIINLSHMLTRIYHEAHRGGEPMNIALEKFILNL